MKAPRYRAWYFQHPDFTGPESLPGGSGALGIQTSPTGGIAMIEDDEAVRQALLLLLSTTPGERAMRPEYGCSLNRLVFSRVDESTAGLAIHYVRQAVTRWEPRVEITHLDAGPDPNDPARLLIELRYMVKVSQRQNTMLFNFDLSGQGI